MKLSILLLLLLLVACGGVEEPPRVVQDERPNILLIYTDDQRWDTLCPAPTDMGNLCGTARSSHPMPHTEDLRDQSVVFANAFVSQPLCCPSRTSLLTGLYSHHHGITSNRWPQGGAERVAEIDDVTLATRLQEAGYTTGWVGSKYVNDYDKMVYGENGEAYIPPGWDRFAVPHTLVDGLDNFGVVVYDGLPITPTLETRQLSGPESPDLVEWERQQAEDFINDACPDECAAPFFLIYSTWAPHLPAKTPPEYASRYRRYLYDGRGFNEALSSGGLADKPYHVRMKAGGEDPTLVIESTRNQLRQLRWLDDQLAILLATLEAKGLSDNTIIVFTSDNGWLWGEHGILDKTHPYEESIRVPLFIHHPDWQATTLTPLVSADIDLPPTILAWAGAEPLDGDGLDLNTLVANPAGLWRDSTFHMGGFNLDDYALPGAWVGVRTSSWKYVEYITGERELYNLLTDPFESRNLIGTIPEEAIAPLVSELGEYDRPLMITTEGLPDRTLNVLPPAVTGESYTLAFHAWGGHEPYVWAVYQDELNANCIGELPSGLALSEAGELAGVTEAAGTFDFCLMVEDASGQEDYRRFSLLAE